MVIKYITFIYISSKNNNNKKNHIGKLVEIRRLYCQIDPLGFEGVGWVINDDINRCMICSTEFGIYIYSLSNKTIFTISY